MRIPGVGAVGASRAPDERQDDRPTLVIFVGGGFDMKTNILQGFINFHERDLSTVSHVRFDHDRPGQILDAIADAPPDTRIVLVGHSWGADQAAQIAARLGAKGLAVDMLVTVDPVGRGLSENFMERVRNGADQWVNIRATGGGPLERSNLIARIGGTYGNAPDAFAHRTIEAPFNHGNFGALLRHAPVGGGSAWSAILRR